MHRYTSHHPGVNDADTHFPVGLRVVYPAGSDAPVGERPLRYRGRASRQRWPQSTADRRCESCADVDPARSRCGIAPHLRRGHEGARPGPGCRRPGGGARGWCPQAIAFGSETTGPLRATAAPGSRPSRRIAPDLYPSAVSSTVIKTKPPIRPSVAGCSWPLRWVSGMISCETTQIMAPAANPSPSG